jgi:hypothetical protein
MHQDYHNIKSFKSKSRIQSCPEAGVSPLLHPLFCITLEPQKQPWAGRGIYVLAYLLQTPSRTTVSRSITTMTQLNKPCYTNESIPTRISEHKKSLPDQANNFISTTLPSHRASTFRFYLAIAPINTQHPVLQCDIRHNYPHTHTHYDHPHNHNPTTIRSRIASKR